MDQEFRSILIGLFWPGGPRDVVSQDFGQAEVLTKTGGFTSHGASG